MTDEDKNNNETQAYLAQATPSAGFLEQVMSNVTDLIFSIDLQKMQLAYSNHDFFRHLGWDLDYHRMTLEDRLVHWSKMIHHDEFAVSSNPTEFIAELCTQGNTESVFRLRHADGEWRHFQTRRSSLSLDGGGEHTLIVARDITASVNLDQNRRMAAKVFENSGEGIMILDADLQIVQINSRLLDISGYLESDLLGSSPLGLLLPNESDLMDEVDAGMPSVGFYENALSQGHSQVEGFGLRKGGEAFHSLTSCSVLRDANESTQFVIVTLRDITDSKTREERIRHLAYYDALTELPNRTLFHDRLVHEMQRCERNQHYAALLFLDLDQFKAVNDSLGHAAGDSLLRIASERLKENVRTEDTVARMSGDEFTIILNGQQSKDHVTTAAAHVARKILRELSEPFHLDGAEAFVSVSIGISVYPDDGTSSSDLLRSADTAMYFAKEAGKNNFQFYTAAMNAHSIEQLNMQNSLYRAVADHEFEVFYQPQHSYTENAGTRVESLLRWRQPDGTLIAPADFLQLAEQTGLIIRMGDWLIERSLWQFSEWRSMDLPVERLAINLSSRQLADEKLVRNLSELLAKYRIPGEVVELEFTESVLMTDLSVTRRVLDQLKGLGVSIIIDDFGTGYSSLNHLKELPIDAIKIDQMFIAKLPGKEADQKLIKAIVAVAEGFDFRVVAEGVETEEQSEFVQQLGCEAAQGYLFAQPMPAYELEKTLKGSEDGASAQKSA